MTLDVGTPVPPITGTDMVKDVPWALADFAGYDVLLVFSGITWCPACQYEAPFLEPVWQQLNGKTTKPFTMAIISGGWVEEEDPAALKAAIARYGIMFPVVRSVPEFPGFGYWHQNYYDIDAAPTVYCLHWDAESQRHIVGSSYTASLDKEGLLEFLHRCGVEEKSATVAALSKWSVSLLYLLGGAPHGGPGIGVPHGGGPIPIPPHGPLLGRDGRDAITGLAVAELAGSLQDPAAREVVRQAGISATEGALRRLKEAPQSPAPPSGLASRRPPQEGTR